MHTNHRRGIVKRRDHRWRENTERDIWRRHVQPPPFNEDPRHSRMKVGRKRPFKIECRWYAGDTFGWFRYCKTYARARDRQEALRTLRLRAENAKWFHGAKEYRAVDVIGTPD